MYGIYQPWNVKDWGTLSKKVIYVSTEIGQLISLSPWFKFLHVIKLLKYIGMSFRKSHNRINSNLITKVMHIKALLMALCNQWIIYLVTYLVDCSKTTLQI